MIPAFLLLAWQVSAATPALDAAIREAADPCRAAARADEIIVCARNRRDPQRFRLPQMPDTGFDPRGTVDSIVRERGRLMDADGAGPDLTRGSCSAVGASGTTGCMAKAWREADQQKGY